MMVPRVIHVRARVEPKLVKTPLLEFFTIMYYYASIGHVSVVETCGLMGEPI